MKFYFLSKKGFTSGLSVFEIIISIAIVTLIGSLSTYMFSSLNLRQSLEQNKKSISSMLEQARTLTLAGKDKVNYGVHFESDRIVGFKGDVYDSLNSENKTEIISPLVGITNISLMGGGSEVVFDRLYGTTSNPGTIVVSLLDGTASSTITVFESGIIE